MDLTTFCKLPLDIRREISSYIYPEIKIANWIDYYDMSDIITDIATRFEDYPDLICNTIYGYHSCETQTLYHHFAIVVDKHNGHKLKWHEECRHTVITDFIRETVNLLHDVPLHTLYYIFTNFIYLSNMPDCIE